MSQLRIIGLLLLCVGLGYLVWLDNTAGGDTAASVTTDATATAGAQPGNGEITGLDDDAPANEGELAHVRDEESDPPAPEDAEDQADAEPENLNPLKRFEIDILSDTIERPIFASSRQRPPQEAKPASTSENSLATFELVGVARTGDRATAVLRRQPRGELFRVETGDTFGKWRVKAIEPRSIVLSDGNGNEESIKLLRP